MKKCSINKASVALYCLSIIHARSKNNYNQALINDSGINYIVLISRTTKRLLVAMKSESLCGATSIDRYEYNAR